MGKFLLRVIINAIAIAITASLLPGIHVVNRDLGTLLIIGLIFGLINALLKPILSFHPGHSNSAQHRLHHLRGDH